MTHTIEAVSTQAASFFRSAPFHPVAEVPEAAETAGTEEEAITLVVRVFIAILRGFVNVARLWLSSFVRIETFRWIAGRPAFIFVVLKERHADGVRLTEPHFHVAFILLLPGTRSRLPDPNRATKGMREVRTGFQEAQGFLPNDLAREKEPLSCRSARAFREGEVERCCFDLERNGQRTMRCGWFTKRSFEKKNRPGEGDRDNGHLLKSSPGHHMQHPRIPCS